MPSSGISKTALGPRLLRSLWPSGSFGYALGRHLFQNPSEKGGISAHNKKTLSFRIFVSGKIPRPHSGVRPGQFVHPSLLLKQHRSYPTFNPSVHSSVQERERLDHAVGEQTDRPTQRPIRSFAGPPARPSAVVKSSTFRISRDYIPFLCSPDAARAATPAAVR